MCCGHFLRTRPCAASFNPRSLWDRPLAAGAHIWPWQLRPTRVRAVRAVAPHCCPCPGIKGISGQWGRQIAQRVSLLSIACVVLAINPSTQHISHIAAIRQH